MFEKNLVISPSHANTIHICSTEGCLESSHLLWFLLYLPYLGPPYSTPPLAFVSSHGRPSKPHLVITFFHYLFFHLAPHCWFTSIGIAIFNATIVFLPLSNSAFDLLHLGLHQLYLFSLSRPKPNEQPCPNVHNVSFRIKSFTMVRYAKSETTNCIVFVCSKIPFIYYPPKTNSVWDTSSGW